MPRGLLLECALGCFAGDENTHTFYSRGRWGVPQAREFSNLLNGALEVMESERLEITAARSCGRDSCHEWGGRPCSIRDWSEECAIVKGWASQSQHALADVRRFPGLLNQISFSGQVVNDRRLFEQVRRLPDR
jgi:hypothetical protein